MDVLARLSLRTRVPALAQAVPVAGVLAAVLGLIAVEGGFYPRDWMPVGLGLALALAVCAWQGFSLPPSRLARVALGLLAGLVAWDLLSVLWADLPGDAWEAGNRFLLYALAAAILALYPWSTRSGRIFLIAWTLGLTAALVISAAYASGFGDPRDVMINGRFSYPVGYAGGSAALAVMGVAPALLLSSRREVHFVLRPLLLAAAAFLALYALLPQSRGAVIGVIAAGVALLALGPQRPRLAARLVALGLIVWLTAGPVLDAYTPFDESRVDPSILDRAWRSMALAAGLAAVCGALLPLLEDRLPAPSEASMRRGRRGVALGLAVLALVGVVVVAANGAGVRDEAHDRWTEFKGGRGVAASGPSRLTATGDPTRYDYWRVALKAFGDHPVAGIGAGSYEPAYARDRDHSKYARYPHSLPLQLMAETGLVGFLLFAGAVGCALAAVLAGRRALEPPGRAVVTGCVVVAVCMLGHASVDWVDQLPSVAIPGLGFLFVAVRVAGPPSPPRGPRATRIALALLALLSCVSLLATYAGIRWSERAESSWRTDPRGALTDLDRSQSVNPLSLRTQLKESSIAIELGRYGRARAALEDATDVSDSWFAHLQLAMLDAETGRFAAARAQAQRAFELNPTEPFVKSVRDSVRKGERLNPKQVNRELRREARAQFR